MAATLDRPGVDLRRIEAPATLDGGDVLEVGTTVHVGRSARTICWEPKVDDPALFESFFTVPEEHGTAVVVVDDRAVLLSADAPETAALLRSRGLAVTTVAISEFEELEGCVTCLSVRLRD